MSEPARKRTRTEDSPNQWSWIGQAWNASTLAERVTELEETNKSLQHACEAWIETSEQNESFIQQINEECAKYKVAFEHAQNLLQKQKMENQTLSRKLEEAQAQSSDLKENHESLEAELRAENERIQQENAELKRSLNEYKGRTKTWRVRYEKLVDKGAAALASKTVSEYGVTPDEVTLYKNFAAKQAEAARAAEAAREAAVQATQLGLKALENSI